MYNIVVRTLPPPKKTPIDPIRREDDMLPHDDGSHHDGSDLPRPPLLTVDRLALGFEDGAQVLRDVSFTVEPGECLGLVGESGCGKSLTALAILGLLPAGARCLGGSIKLDGTGDLLALGAAERRRCRGRQIAMIFQEPMSALNPVLTIGFQIGEALAQNRGLKGRAARRAALELLERVAMPDPGRRLRSYPHELSGGQRQRAMIALALASVSPPSSPRGDSEPRLLLADEPTTALDVTVQAQILELLLDLRRELGLTVIFITHDLGVVAQCCDRVVVMYAGQVVEIAPTAELFARPAHPYSRALLAAVPRLGTKAVAGGIPGQVPELGDLPGGCTFHPRCAEVFAPCRQSPPELVALAPGHAARCFLHDRETRT